MPANLPPQYYELEKQYRSAKSIPEKLAILEEMLSTMPKHKGTDKLQADLKKRISKLKVQDDKKGGKRVFGYTVRSEGAGQIVLIGPPNSGKSSLLRALTRAEPDVADYPFTTRTPMAGMAQFEDVQLQLVDLPPLVDGYIEPWLPDIIRQADLWLILLDLGEDPLQQLDALEDVLEARKIFLAGGREPGHVPGKVIRPAVIAANKVDLPGAEETLEIFQELLGPDRPVIPLSVVRADNLNRLPRLLFERLDVMRIYTKTPGNPADMAHPYVVPRGTTAVELAARVHNDIASSFKYARIWGSETHDGRMVQRDYALHDRDVIEIHA